VIYGNTEFADASPLKRLFISLLTRDISLADAFLDLIDNSINAAIIEQGLKLQKPRDFVDLLKIIPSTPRPFVKIVLQSHRLEIRDNAGGISFSDALKDTFRFGRPGKSTSEDKLSVYGIGMKRALLKMGNKIDILSNHRDGGFSLNLNVDKWASETPEEDTPEHWTIPISRYKGPESLSGEIIWDCIAFST
jgi:hypothetical protein